MVALAGPITGDSIDLTNAKWVVEPKKSIRRLDLDPGKLNVVLSKISRWFDEKVVDGSVALAGNITDSAGSVVRLFQTGRVQQYAAVAVGGGLLLAAWLILA